MKFEKSESEEILEVKEYVVYICDYCMKAQNYAVVKTKYSEYVEPRGNLTPVTLSGLEERHFCSDLCAMQYVIKMTK